jgi:hypothetical protein
MRNFFRWGLLYVALAVATSARATIEQFNQLAIDFTNPQEAGAKAEWQPRLNSNQDGLGFSAAAPETVEGWLQTKPVAIGLSWRPATAVNLRIKISPAPKLIKLDNGETCVPFVGRVYARYSPDMKHWSSWQSLQENALAGTNNMRNFSGQMSVPQREYEAYGKLISEYSGLDVPWKSDEEAAVKWIIERDPKFFEHNLPFMGHLEFLFEAPFQGGQRILSFKAEMNYAVGGTYAEPKDKSIKENARSETPWRYKARE